jgi:hypothetical protein
MVRLSTARDYHRIGGRSGSRIWPHPLQRSPATFSQTPCHPLNRRPTRERCAEKLFRHREGRRSLLRGRIRIDRSVRTPHLARGVRHDGRFQGEPLVCVVEGNTATGMPKRSTDSPNATVSFMGKRHVLTSSLSRGRQVVQLGVRRQ